jgi:meso-butanediol dehydrogenase / (S,S)-butanediol dehydrogenase / diacetyl reductase
MSQVTWNFAGKRVLVTGGATGIGFAIGQEFLLAGAQVTFLGRDEQSLEKAVSAASAASGNGKALSLTCDLAKPPDIVRAAQAATELMGGVDILVNNAGVGGSRELVELSDEELDLHLNVNLRATILLTRGLLRGMLEQGEGVVINISSQAGKRGFPGITHYSASKAGVIGFTRSLAAEVAPRVRVNAVCPGMVLTAMMQNNIQQTSDEKNISLDDARAEWSSGIPLGRMQQPVDVANAVLFLASDAATEITGVALDVSGGQTMY